MRTLLLFSALLMGLLFTSCGGSENENAESETTENTESSTQSPSQAKGETSDATASEGENKKGIPEGFAEFFKQECLKQGSTDEDCQCLVDHMADNMDYEAAEFLFEASSKLNVYPEEQPSRDIMTAIQSEMQAAAVHCDSVRQAR